MGTTDADILKAHKPATIPEALSLEARKRVIRSFLPLAVVGLRQHVELSVRAPYVSGIASLSLDRPEWTDADVNMARWNAAEPGVPSKQDVTVTLKIVETGRPHLVSFYLNSDALQKFSVQVEHQLGKDYDQDLEVPAGPSTLSFVFTLGSPGECWCCLKPSEPTLTEGSIGFNFFKVEIWVVDLPNP